MQYKIRIKHLSKWNNTQKNTVWLNRNFISTNLVQLFYLKVGYNNCQICCTEKYIIVNQISVVITIVRCFALFDLFIYLFSFLHESTGRDQKGFGFLLRKE